MFGYFKYYFLSCEIIDFIFIFTKIIIIFILFKNPDMKLFIKLNENERFKQKIIK